MAVAPSGQPWVRSGQPSVSGLHPWRLETSVVGLRRLARVLLPGPHIGAAYPPLIPLTPGHSGSAGDTRVAQTMVKADSSKEPVMKKLHLVLQGKGGVGKSYVVCEGR